MARERMVTRTIYTTAITVMTVNTETREVHERIIDIPSIDSLKDVNRAISHQVELFYPSEKYVSEISRITSEILYGMSESEFIRLSQILPPRIKEEYGN